MSYDLSNARLAPLGVLPTDVVSHTLDLFGEKKALTFKRGQKTFTAECQQLPGCCGVLLCYYLGLNRLVEPQDESLLVFVRIMEYAALLLGYTIIMATHVTDSKWQWAFESCGWAVDRTFVNERTGNRVYVFAKHLIRGRKRVKV
jgi:hypothetical protein